MSEQRKIEAAGKTVLVCGGREYADRAHVFEVLDKLHADTPIARLIHGGARGADQLAGEWADSRRVPQTPVYAQWKTLGRAAGPFRNQQMIRMNPDLVVAFPGGPGTADMVRRAVAAGVPVIHA